MLSVHDLTVVFSDGRTYTNIVEEISFTIDRGDSLGIVGESGSGKTMTALSLLRLLPHGMEISSGEILYASGDEPTVDLVSLSQPDMRTFRGKVMAMIFQEPMSSLNPSMNCGAQVCEAVKLHTRLEMKEAESRTLELFREVDLPAESIFYRKYPHQLSGGQRQRVMIAMALAGNPEILLADEPTTALDVTVQRKILELLDRIRRQRGMGLIFISHDLGVIRMVCDRALIMHRGRIVESGSIDKIFSQAEHPYTRGLLACRPRLSAGRERLPVMQDFLENTDATAVVKSAEPVTKIPGSAKNGPHPILEVRDLQSSYVLRKNFLGRIRRSLDAIDRVSFHILKGETLGLIGESGCGKSTLGRSIIQLVRARHGNILYEGLPVQDLQGRKLNAFRREVQFVFQDPYSSLNPGIRIGRAITEVMRVHGLHGNRTRREQAALDLLGKVGLPPAYFQRYPHEFSGGQRQRIGIARALATDPKLIICDESVSSLDVSVQAQILNLLNELKDALGLTYLFISHDLAVVKYMSDRIMVMKDGRLLETAGADELFLNPGTDYTRDLITAIPE
jgi:peptide/nickel transport system ATP-binding protein